MGWHLQTTKTIVMTKRLAEKFRDMTPVPNERPLGTPRLSWLRRQLETGALSFEWGIAVLDGKEFRVNGQHSSHLLSAHPELITEHMRAVVATYHCDTASDLANLYAKFDNNRSSRSTGDVNWSYAASMGNGLSGVPKHVINVCVTAICYDKWGVTGYQAVDREDRAAYALESESSFILFCKELKEGIDDGDWRVLKRAPVIWAMLATWRKNRKDAMKFWRLVATGGGADNKSPDRKLSRYLDQTSVAYGGGVRNDARKVGGAEFPEVMHSKCIHAWNAWRKDAPTNLRVYKNPDGTPKLPRAL
jgi:predicted 3-demethylubiquinone-9 3-methyltransferase (glyoxalase superfamily)